MERQQGSFSPFYRRRKQRLRGQSAHSDSPRWAQRSHVPVSPQFRTLGGLGVGSRPGRGGAREERGGAGRCHAELRLGPRDRAPLSAPGCEPACAASRRARAAPPIQPLRPPLAPRRQGSPFPSSRPGPCGASPASAGPSAPAREDVSRGGPGAEQGPPRRPLRAPASRAAPAASPPRDMTSKPLSDWIPYRYAGAGWTLLSR